MTKNIQGRLVMKLMMVVWLACIHVALSQGPSSSERIRTALSSWVGSTVDLSSGKCATPLVFEAVRQKELMPAATWQEVSKALQWPTRQKNRLSPSGRFRIHYDTTGANQPAMISGMPASRVTNSYEEYVDSVAAIFDRAWTEEVDNLGFEPPPSDNGRGGGNEYDVFIEALPPLEFGSTSWLPEDSLETGVHQRYPTYITIDVDFLGERTEGMNGLRVTAAHEFHHAIQVGVYGIWLNIPSADFYFYELSAVWLEEVMFDGINDYYFDLPAFFQTFRDGSNNSFAFSAFLPGRRGYERCVWALFLEKRFGRDVLREIWSAMKQSPALFSMDEVLRMHGSSLAHAFSEFGYWNLFTGFRADPVLSYEEGANYPSLVMNATGTFSGSSTSMSGFGYPFSLQYYRFDLGVDSVAAVIANTNFLGAYTSPGLAESFTVTLGTSVQGASQTLSNGLSAGFSTSAIEKWRTRYVGLVGRTDIRRESRPAPNPLRLSRSALLTLPSDDFTSGSAEVFFLTSALDLAYSGVHPIVQNLGKSEILIPTSTLAGALSSGMYFVVVKTAEREQTWKLVVIR